MVIDRLYIANSYTVTKVKKNHYFFPWFIFKAEFINLF